MSRSRWTPFLYALVAGAAAWAAWRFLPRDLLRRCGLPASGPPREGWGPRPAPPPPEEPRPRTAAPGSPEARVVEPDPTGDPEPPAAGATQAEDPARCTAETQGGTRCSREAEPGSVYCWQHGGG